MRDERADKSIQERLRDDSDDPYFMIAPENNGHDLKWLQANWSLRKEAAATIDSLQAQVEGLRSALQTISDWSFYADGTDGEAPRQTLKEINAFANTRLEQLKPRG